MTSEKVLAFWFEELTPKSWWEKSVELDQQIRERFGDTHAAATRGELHSWRVTAPGRLAEIIVLDQFSRNMFRDTPQAFAYDPIALVLAQEAVGGGHDKELAEDHRMFLYMPFMHSESAAIHELAVELFSQPSLEQNLKFEHAHKAIIDRFGRYPHRNEILARASTPEELAFLKEPGSSF